MDAGATLRQARARAGLTQAELAARAGTSQAAVSAYENGSKRPSLDTFGRLLAATGSRLTVLEDQPAVFVPSEADLAKSGETLSEVIALAEALPVTHERELRYPRLRAA